MKLLFAQIMNGIVFGVFEFDEQPKFHPRIVMVQCDDTVKAGDLYDEDVFTTPPASVPDPITEIKSRVFIKRFSGLELRRIKILSDDDDDMLKFWLVTTSAESIELTDPDLISDMARLVSANVMNQARSDAILLPA